ncbi:hypothetical protein UK12_30385, partial [Saccharothrix sp. ST-888]
MRHRQTAEQWATRQRAAQQPPVIQIRHLLKAYGHGDATVHALRGPLAPGTGEPQGVSLDIEQGDYVAVMGSS